MTTDYQRDVEGISQHVDVDGEGEVCVYYPNGSWDRLHDEDCIDFTIEELETILRQAKAHQFAYELYRADDFEDTTYNQAYDHHVRMLQTER